MSRFPIVPVVETTERSRLGVSLTPNKKLSPRMVLELAQYAETLGYESVWIPESWGYDAVSILGMLAAGTSRIKLASGILNVYSRSAALIAQTAATLQAISDDRFILGLGTSGPLVVENWHGVSFEKPLRRTREYVHTIRLALTGDAVHAARAAEVHPGFRLAAPTRMSPPIYLAALGTQNLRLTGEIADGWLPVFAALGSIPKLAGHMREGAERSHRDVGQIDVAAYIPVAIAPDGEDQLRQQVAHYIGGMGTFYREFAERMGFEREAARISELWERGERRSAAASVDDRLLEVCTLGADTVTAKRRLGDYRAEGVALPILAFPGPTPPATIAASLEALTPSRGPG